MLRPTALAVCAIDDEDVGAVCQLEYLLAEHRIAGVGDCLAADVHLVPEGLHAVRHVVHRGCAEGHRARLLSAASDVRIDVHSAIACVLRMQLRVAAAGEVLHPVLNAGRAYDVELLAALAHVKVLQEQEGQADEVVAVVMREEDHLDLWQVDLELFEVGEQRRRRIELIAAVHKE